MKFSLRPTDFRRREGIGGHEPKFQSSKLTLEVPPRGLNIGSPDPVQTEKFLLFDVTFFSVIDKILIGKKEWSKVNISLIRLHQRIPQVLVVIWSKFERNPAA